MFFCKKKKARALNIYVEHVRNSCYDSQMCIKALWALGRLSLVKTGRPG